MKALPATGASLILNIPGIHTPTGPLRSFLPLQQLVDFIGHGSVTGRAQGRAFEAHPFGRSAKGPFGAALLLMNYNTDTIPPMVENRTV
jgi:hypothetical protein